jgi:hypothetical protein
MGSSRRSKFTRAPTARSVESSEVELDSKLYEVLDHLGKAIAVVETVARALEAAEQDLECAAVGAEICTIRQAAIWLRAVHEELDRAIPEYAP